MAALVSDTSVLIDLDRGGLVTACLSHNWGLVVPDILYASEIKPFTVLASAWGGLQIAVLSGAELGELVRIRTAYRRLSASDAAALALAKGRDWRLITSDNQLRTAATREGVEVHGLLWVFDELYNEGVVGPSILHSALQTIANHPTSRLPTTEVNARLAVYR